MAEVDEPGVWSVKAVEEMTTADGQLDLWVIVYQVPASVWPDGEYRYGFPKAALEGRAAEYGLTDVDEVLDILVWEPVLAFAQTAGITEQVVPSRMDAASARKMIRDQIAACQARFATVDKPAASARARTAAADPLQAIREQVRIDPVRTAALRLEMDRRRMTEGAL